MTYQEKREAINRIYKACADEDQVEAETLYMRLDDQFENNEFRIPLAIDGPLRYNLGLLFLKEAEKEAEDILPSASEINSSLKYAREYLGNNMPLLEREARRILKKGLDTHIFGMIETAEIYGQVFDAQKTTFDDYCKKTGLTVSQERVDAIDRLAREETMKIYGQPIRLVHGNELN